MAEKPHELQELLNDSTYKERDAVAGAIMISVAQQVNEHLDGEKKIAQQVPGWAKVYKETLKRSPKGLIAEATASECRFASRMVLYHLATEKAELFSDLFLIKGSSNLMNAMPYDKHYMFVAKGKDGRFFAGSPANYLQHDNIGKLLETTNPLTTILEADSLGELLETIKGQFGGNWPSEGFVENALSKDKSFDIKGKGNEKEVAVLTLQLDPQDGAIATVDILAMVDGRLVDDSLPSYSFKN